jgi:hypothetical protein
LQIHTTKFADCNLWFCTPKKLSIFLLRNEPLHLDLQNKKNKKNSSLSLQTHPKIQSMKADTAGDTKVLIDK